MIKRNKSCILQTHPVAHTSKEIKRENNAAKFGTEKSGHKHECC
jgi:hypothetical protein